NREPAFVLFFYHRYYRPGARSSEPRMATTDRAFDAARIRQVLGYLPIVEPLVYVGVDDLSIKRHVAIDASDTGCIHQAECRIVLVVTVNVAIEAEMVLLALLDHLIGLSGILILTNLVDPKPAAELRGHGVGRMARSASHTFHLAIRNLIGV